MIKISVEWGSLESLTESVRHQMSFKRCLDWPDLQWSVLDPSRPSILRHLAADLIPEN